MLFYRNNVITYSCLAEKKKSNILLYKTNLKYIGIADYVNKQITLREKTLSHSFSSLDFFSRSFGFAPPYPSKKTDFSFFFFSPNISLLRYQSIANIHIPRCYLI